MEFALEVAESVFRDGAKTDALGKLVEAGGKVVERGAERGVFGVEGSDFRAQVGNSLLEAGKFEVSGAVKGEGFVEGLGDEVLVDEGGDGW